MAQHAALGAATRLRHRGSGPWTHRHQTRDGRLSRKHHPPGGSGARNESRQEIQGRHREDAPGRVSLGRPAPGARPQRRGRRSPVILNSGFWILNSWSWVVSEMCVERKQRAIRIAVKRKWISGYLSSQLFWELWLPL